MGGYLSNAMLIFDYQSATDFKFAGAYVGANRWLVGHRTASGWIEDATFGQTINALADYQLQLVVEGGHQVTLFVDGVSKITRMFSDDVTDGDVGVGTRNALSRFDDFAVREHVVVTGILSGGPSEMGAPPPDGLGAFSSVAGVVAAVEALPARPEPPDHFFEAAESDLSESIASPLSDAAAATWPAVIDRVMSDDDFVDELSDALGGEVSAEVLDEALRAVLRERLATLPFWQ
jgi:hypothetical protein